MRVWVTNSNCVSSSIVLAFDEFKAGSPSIIFNLKDHPCKSCSDTLSSEYVVIATTYLNNIVENFEKRLLYYFHRSIKMIHPASSYKEKKSKKI